MSYKAGIAEAILELKDRNGSSMIALKKFMQGKLASDKKWMNTMFLTALKSGVASGDFVQNKVRVFYQPFHYTACMLALSFLFFGTTGKAVEATHPYKNRKSACLCALGVHG